MDLLQSYKHQLRNAEEILKKYEVEEYAPCVNECRRSIWEKEVKHYKDVIKTMEGKQTIERENNDLSKL